MDKLRLNLFYNTFNTLNIYNINLNILNTISESMLSIFYILNILNIIFNILIVFNIILNICIIIDRKGWNANFTNSNTSLGTRDFIWPTRSIWLKLRSWPTFQIYLIYQIDKIVHCRNSIISTFSMYIE